MRRDGDHDTALGAARAGFAGAGAAVLFESVHGRDAVILLETGGSGHSYPYGVLCRRTDSVWATVASANSPSWYPTEDGAGVLLFWEEAPAGPAHVEFQGGSYEAEVCGGYAISALWNVPDPGDQPDLAWPRVVPSA